jgi:threonine/homoserine/homoserine lactone efflux protein
MEYLLPLATLTLVHLMAVISPGPGFLYIAKTAMAGGRAPALAASMGMAAGAVVWAVAAMLGTAVILQQAAWAYSALRIAGGLYLIYLAVMVWKHAQAAVVIGSAKGQTTQVLAAVRNGFLIEMSNPKVIVFFGSIFFALLPPGAPFWVSAVALGIVLLNEAVWFSLVALLFSASRPREAYMRVKPSIDRLMAGVLGMIGTKLIIDAR